MKNRRLLLAFIASTILTFAMALLSNVATTFLAPTWAEKPWIIYILLALIFFISLPISIYLFLKTSPNLETAAAIGTKDNATSQASKPKDDGLPIPKINPLPDNIYGKIAFLKGRDYVIANSDGSNEFVVTNANWSIYSPRIAPGGEKIVFASAHEGQDNIYIINRDGSNLKRLTGPARAKRDGYASWSPDGAKLIFFREYSYCNDIYIMDSRGNDQINLTNIRSLGNLWSNEFSEFPWSPDGKKVVFTSNRDGFRKIYVMDKNGKNTRQITNNSETQDYGAVWAPNRNVIAYVSTGGVNGETDILTLNVDSPRAKPINITKSPYHDTSPVWSPDGTQILFVSNRDSDSELYIMNSDGSNVRRVTHTAGPKDNPSWLR